MCSVSVSPLYFLFYYGLKHECECYGEGSETEIQMQEDGKQASIIMDDTAFMTETREDTHHTVDEFEGACDRMRLKVKDAGQKGKEGEL